MKSEKKIETEKPKWTKRWIDVDIAVPYVHLKMVILIVYYE